MVPRGVLLVLVVLLATSASARLVGITTGSNYTVGLSVLNETSGFSTVGSSTWGWSLSNLASGFMVGSSQYSTLLDNYNGQKAVVTFNVSSGAIVSSLTINTNLSIDAISYDPTSSNVLVIQQDWVNGAIQVGVLSTKDGSVKNVAALSGFLFVGATNAVDPATGLLYLAAQDVNGNYTLFGVTFSGAVKVNVSLQLEGIDDVSGFVVCNSKLFGIGTQAWPNQTIDVISINTKSGSITQMNILQDSGLTVYLGLTAVNPTANLLYFGTAEGLNTNAVVTVVNVSSRAIVSDAPIQGMVTAAWAYTN